VHALPIAARDRDYGACLWGADGLWPRARGVPWNRADDLCLALELRIERGERRELSGRLVEIKPRRAFAR
jgi:hypothetical protein